MISAYIWVSNRQVEFYSLDLGFLPCCRCEELQYIAIGKGLSSTSQNPSSPPIARLVNLCIKRLDNDSASFRPALCFGHLIRSASKSSPTKKLEVCVENKSWYASSVKKGQYTSVDSSMNCAASPISVGEGVKRICTPRLCRNASSCLENDGSCAYNSTFDPCCRSWSAMATKIVNCLILRA